MGWVHFFHRSRPLCSFPQPAASHILGSHRTRSFTFTVPELVSARPVLHVVSLFPFLFCLHPYLLSRFGVAISLSLTPGRKAEEGKYLLFRGRLMRCWLSPLLLVMRCGYWKSWCFFGRECSYFFSNHLLFLLSESLFCQLWSSASVKSSNQETKGSVTQLTSMKSENCPWYVLPSLSPFPKTEWAAVQLLCGPVN